MVDIKPPNYFISSVTGDNLWLLHMWTHSPDLCSTGGQTFGSYEVGVEGKLSSPNQRFIELFELHLVL